MLEHVSRGCVRHWGRTSRRCMLQIWYQSMICCKSKIYRVSMICCDLKICRVSMNLFDSYLTPTIKEPGAHVIYAPPGFFNCRLIYSIHLNRRQDPTPNYAVPCWGNSCVHCHFHQRQYTQHFRIQLPSIAQSHLNLIAIASDKYQGRSISSNAHRF